MLYIKGRPVARSTARSTEHGPKVAKAYTTYCSQPQVDGCQYIRVPDPILSHYDYTPSQSAWKNQAVMLCVLMMCVME